MTHQPRPAARGADCEGRLQACEAELRRAATDIEGLIARSAAQVADARRLAAVVAQHERAKEQMLTNAERLAAERARLADLVAGHERQAEALQARIARHETEYRRLTRLLAERAHEIFELQLALGRPRRSATASGKE